MLQRRRRRRRCPWSIGLRTSTYRRHARRYSAQRTTTSYAAANAPQRGCRPACVYACTGTRDYDVRNRVCEAAWCGENQLGSIRCYANARYRNPLKDENMRINDAVAADIALDADSTTSLAPSTRTAVCGGVVVVGVVVGVMRDARDARKDHQ